MSSTNVSSTERLAAALVEVIDVHRHADSVEGVFNLTQRVREFDAALVERVIDIVRAQQVVERLQDDYEAAALEDEMHSGDQYGGE